MEPANTTGADMLRARHRDAYIVVVRPGRSAAFPMGIAPCSCCRSLCVCSDGDLFYERTGRRPAVCVVHFRGRVLLGDIRYHGADVRELHPADLYGGGIIDRDAPPCDSSNPTQDTAQGVDVTFA